MTEEYAQKSFQFWVSYYDTARDLEDGDRLAFYDAIMEYIFLDSDPEEKLKESKLEANGKQTQSIPYFAFKGIKANLKTSKIRSASGLKGGRPSGENAVSTGVSNDSEKSEKANGKQAESKRKASGKQNENKDKYKDKVKLKNKGKLPMSFGKHGNVILTQDERSQLDEKVTNPSALIEDLSDYMQTSGRQYADHLAVLMQWAERNGTLREEKRRCAREGCTSLLYRDGQKGWTCPIHGTKGVTA